MKSTFSGFIAEADDQVLVTEAFNSAPYDLTFGKKSAGDIFFTFHDEDDKEFRIQFYTPQGLGRNVRQVFIGTKKGASYLDSQQKFKNPLRVASTMIEATKQFLDTPIGKSIDGFAINFSKKVMDRGIKLLPKIIRQSGLKQKLNVMDLNYSPDDSRGYVWVVRKGKDPAAVFDGPKMKGITWDDPDKIGDVPPTAPSEDDNWSVTDAKYYPIMSYRKGRVTYSIWPNQVKTGTYIGHIVGKTAMSYGETPEEVASQLKLPTVPADILKQFKEIENRLGANKVELPKFMTSRDLDAHPFRREVLQKLNSQLASEGIAQPGSSLGYYKYQAGGTFRVFFMGVKENTFTGSVATAKGSHDFTCEFNVDAAVENFMKFIRDDQSPSKVGWVNETNGNGNSSINCYDTKGVIMGGISSTLPTNFWVYTGSSKFVAFKDITDTDVNSLAKKLKLPAIPSDILSKFVVDTESFWKNKGYSILGTSQAKPELNQTRWLALQRAAVNIPNMTSVVSSTSAIGRLRVGNQGSVVVSINKGVLWNDDPVTVTIKALDSKENPLDYSFIMRGIDITKPAELTKAVKAKVDEAVKLINTKVPPSVELDKQSMIKNLQMLEAGGGEIDWQIREYQGKIYVDWDITFRRNSKTGAFMQFKTEIGRANAALARMEAYLQKNGYKTQSFILTLDDVRDMDATSDSAYSEYEQSIGGNIIGTK